MIPCLLEILLKNIKCHHSGMGSVRHSTQSTKQCCVILLKCTCRLAEYLANKTKNYQECENLSLSIDIIQSIIRNLIFTDNYNLEVSIKQLSTIFINQGKGIFFIENFYQLTKDIFSRFTECINEFFGYILTVDNSLDLYLKMYQQLIDMKVYNSVTPSISIDFKDAVSVLLQIVACKNINFSDENINYSSECNHWKLFALFVHHIESCISFVCTDCSNKKQLHQLAISFLGAVCKKFPNALLFSDCVLKSNQHCSTHSWSAATTILRLCRYQHDWPLISSYFSIILEYYHVLIINDKNDDNFSSPQHSVLMNVPKLEIMAFVEALQLLPNHLFLCAIAQKKINKCLSVIFGVILSWGSLDEISKFVRLFFKLSYDGQNDNLSHTLYRFQAILSYYFKNMFRTIDYKFFSKLIHYLLYNAFDESTIDKRLLDGVTLAGNHTNKTYLESTLSMMYFLVKGVDSLEKGNDSSLMALGLFSFITDVNILVYENNSTIVKILQSILDSIFKAPSSEPTLNQQFLSILSFEYISKIGPDIKNPILDIILVCIDGKLKENDIRALASKKFIVELSWLCRIFPEIINYIQINCFCALNLYYENFLLYCLNCDHDALSILSLSQSKYLQAPFNVLDTVILDCINKSKKLSMIDSVAHLLLIKQSQIVEHGFSLVDDYTTEVTLEMCYILFESCNNFCSEDKIKTIIPILYSYYGDSEYDKFQLSKWILRALGLINTNTKKKSFIKSLFLIMLHICGRDKIELVLSSLILDGSISVDLRTYLQLVFDLQMKSYKLDHWRCLGTLEDNDPSVSNYLAQNDRYHCFIRYIDATELGVSSIIFDDLKQFPYLLVVFLRTLTLSDQQVIFETIINDYVVNCYSKDYTSNVYFIRDVIEIYHTFKLSNTFEQHSKTILDFVLNLDRSFYCISDNMDAVCTIVKLISTDLFEIIEKVNSLVCFNDSSSSSSSKLYNVPTYVYSILQRCCNGRAKFFSEEKRKNFIELCLNKIFNIKNMIGFIMGYECQHLDQIVTKKDVECFVEIGCWFIIEVVKDFRSTITTILVPEIINICECALFFYEGTCSSVDLKLNKIIQWIHVHFSPRIKNHFYKKRSCWLFPIKCDLYSRIILKNRIGMDTCLFGVQPKTHLDLINKNQLFYSMLHFPVRMTDENRFMAGANTSQIYHPKYILSVLNAVLLESDIDLDIVLKKGLHAYLFVCLSSDCSKQRLWTMYLFEKLAKQMEMDTRKNCSSWKLVISVIHLLVYNLNNSISFKKDLHPTKVLNGFEPSLCVFVDRLPLVNSYLIGCMLGNCVCQPGSQLNEVMLQLVGKMFKKSLKTLHCYMLKSLQNLPALDQMATPFIQHQLLIVSTTLVSSLDTKILQSNSVISYLLSLLSCFERNCAVKDSRGGQSVTDLKNIGCSFFVQWNHLLGSAFNHPALCIQHLRSKTLLTAKEKLMAQYTIIVALIIIMEKNPDICWHIIKQLRFDYLVQSISSSITATHHSKYLLQQMVLQFLTSVCLTMVSLKPKKIKKLSSSFINQLLSFVGSYYNLVGSSSLKLVEVLCFFCSHSFVSTNDLPSFATTVLLYENHLRRLLFDVLKIPFAKDVKYFPHHVLTIFRYSLQFAMHHDGKSVKQIFDGGFIVILDFLETWRYLLLNLSNKWKINKAVFTKLTNILKSVESFTKNHINLFNSYQRYQLTDIVSITVCRRDLLYQWFSSYGSSPLLSSSSADSIVILLDKILEHVKYVE